MAELGAPQGVGKLSMQLFGRCASSKTTRRSSSNPGNQWQRFKTHDEAPRVLIANSNLVGQWNNYTEFNRLERLGLTMYGQMTAGSWIYIGSQGIVQGTFETFAGCGTKTFRWLA